MNLFESSSGVAAGVFPFEPTIVVAVLASIGLVASVAFLVFVAIAPHVSPVWSDRFSGFAPEGDHGIGSDD